jgi:phosphohistidine phosphatase
VAQAVTTVYVVRHAIAEQRDAERWPDDAKRPLTAEGEARFREAARGLRRIAPDVETVLSSPYVRAWRTAEILHEETGWPRPERCEALEADRSPAEAAGVVEGRGSVAVVGHEPFLSGFVGLLLDAPLSIDFKKGGVVLVENGALRWYATPKILRGLSRR